MREAMWKYGYDKDKVVEVTVTARNKNREHYEDLGYEVPKKVLRKGGHFRTPIGSTVMVRQEDISLGNTMLLDSWCVTCGVIGKRTRRDVG